MGLLAHCGTEKVHELEVLRVPEPEFTSTWHPVSHARVINAFQVALWDQGINIMDKEYSLSNDGKQMFASWKLDIHIAGHALTAVFRNSLAKKFRVTYGAGITTFVCDNLCIDGNFLTHRKHTGLLDDSILDEMAGETALSLVPQMQKFAQRTESLREIWLLPEDFKTLTYDAMVSGAVPPSQFKAFLGAYKEELEIDNDETLYAFNAAATRLMRGGSLFSISAKNSALFHVVEDFRATQGVS